MRKRLKGKFHEEVGSKYYQELRIKVLLKTLKFQYKRVHHIQNITTASIKMLKFINFLQKKNHPKICYQDKKKF